MHAGKERTVVRLKAVNGYPDQYWIGLLKELRGYLCYPAPSSDDRIRSAIDSGQLPSQSVKYLEQLYAQPSDDQVVQ